MHINTIGHLVMQENRYVIVLEEKVKKAMTGMESFEHLLLVAITKDQQLRVLTVKVIKIESKQGIILIEQPLEEDELELPVSVVDIKPYMPCADTVHVASSQRKKRSISVNAIEEDSYELPPCGEIRKTNGVCYLQFEELPKEIGDILRIVWWFERFDDKKYRRTLLCNPPYECKERIGVFASRSPVRPNPIALTIAKVLRIDRENQRIYVNDLDCFDHTHFLGVLDYDSAFDCVVDAKGPDWTKDWPKEVCFMKQENDVDSMVAMLDEQVHFQSIKQQPLIQVNTIAESIKRPTHIVVKGARENNLKAINVEIPYGKITAVVGVSGSGKSSLVRDTIYAECKRRMEYLSNDAVEYVRPEMEEMTGCIPTVLIDQKEVRSNVNSTIGTFLGIYHHLRAMYASIGVRHYQNESEVTFKLTPATFSYLDPEARCQTCNGTGRQHLPDIVKIVANPEKSLLDGASPFLGKLKDFLANPNANWMRGQVVALAQEMGVDLAKPWNELPEEFRRIVLQGDTNRRISFSYDNKKNGRKGDIHRIVEGIIPTIERFFLENTDSSTVDKFMSTTVCNTCHGERLAGEGRLVTVAGVRYPVCAKMTFTQMSQWVESLETTLTEVEYGLVKEHLHAIKIICGTARRLGIGYLNLNRLTAEISGGEAQRLKLLSAFQNHMTGILYIFDEPSKKLSSKEYAYIIDMMKQLVDEGNTVLMVEHNMDLIQIADYVIEIGPAAGERGGYLVGEGSFESMVTHGGTMIGRYAKRSHVGKRVWEESGTFHVGPVTYHTLKEVNVEIHKRALTCITGVSGSGKSSLLYGGILPAMEKSKEFDEVVLVESKFAASSSRSILATYAGIMDDIRAMFANTTKAQELEYTEADFGFNRGALRCEHCKGDGRIKIPFTQAAYKSCPICHGSRYKREVQEVLVMDKSIVDVLAMSVEEAVDFFNDLNPSIVVKCELLSRVGLGYLKLSQSTQTLSGGEAARLKIACSLMKLNQKNTLFLLDEPTCGLHFSDIDHLIGLLYELIDVGNTVVAIEHNKRFLEAAQYTITCGPGAGEDGGRIIKEKK